MRNVEVVDFENLNNQVEVEDQNEVNFVFLEHDVVDSLIFDDIYEKMVYIVLKRFANFNSKQSFPGIKRLAQLSCCSDNKVRASLKKLEAKKLIKVTMRKNGHNNLTNKYTILKVTQELKDLHYKKVEEKEENEGKGVLHHVKEGTSPREGGVLHHVKEGTSPREGERKRIKEKEFKEKELKNLSIRDQIKEFVERNKLTGLEKQRLIDRLTNYPPKSNFLSYASKTLDSIRKEIAEEPKNKNMVISEDHYLRNKPVEKEEVSKDQVTTEEENAIWLEELLKGNK